MPSVTYRRSTLAVDGVTKLYNCISPEGCMEGILQAYTLSEIDNTSVYSTYFCPYLFILFLFLHVSLFSRTLFV